MQYIIGIGSNYRQAAQMSAARLRLRRAFGDVHFSAEEQTLPIGIQNEALFANQVACFESTLTPDKVKQMLKQMEVEAGRTPHDKLRGVISIDLDLLAADAQVLKPDDWSRPYIQRGLQSIGIEISKEADK